MGDGETDGTWTDRQTIQQRLQGGEAKSLRGLAPEGAARRPALGEGAPGRLPPEGLFPPELHTVPPLALCGHAMTQTNKEGRERENIKHKPRRTDWTD